MFAGRARWRGVGLLVSLLATLSSEALHARCSSGAHWCHEPWKPASCVRAAGCGVGLL